MKKITLFLQISFLSLLLLGGLSSAHALDLKLLELQKVDLDYRQGFGEVNVEALNLSMGALSLRRSEFAGQLNITPEAIQLNFNDFELSLNTDGYQLPMAIETLGVQSLSLMGSQQGKLMGSMAKLNVDIGRKIELNSLGFKCEPVEPTNAESQSDGFDLLQVIAFCGSHLDLRSPLFRIDKARFAGINFSNIRISGVTIELREGRFVLYGILRKFISSKIFAQGTYVLDKENKEIVISSLSVSASGFGVTQTLLDVIDSLGIDQLERRGQNIVLKL